MLPPGIGNAGFELTGFAPSDSAQSPRLAAPGRRWLWRPGSSRPAGSRCGGGRCVSGPCRDLGFVATPCAGSERHLPVHGRRAEPPRHLRPQARAEPPGRPVASSQLQAGDHPHGRGPRAASGLEAKVEAARPERDLGIRLAPAHRDLRRRTGGDPILLVQRARTTSGAFAR